MDEKIHSDIQREEQAITKPAEPDVKQALMARRESLTKDLASMAETISQTQAEYAANLEKLQNKKRTMEEALQHVTALLRFEGCVPEIHQSDNLHEANDTEPVSLTDAAYELMTGLHEPLHYKEITLKLQEKDIHVPGKDAAATLLSRISRDGRFKRTKRRGVYALSTWRMGETKRQKASKSRRKKKSAM
ncbi:MAG: hypothetical protein HY665_09710 [Chloroflexi bacterium]|nr:hypothetical protein [Chloroflexota bacterium]